MTKESITVSLEWAKKLKEAGWPQDVCTFAWYEVAKPHPANEELPCELDLMKEFRGGHFSFAAPTAEEILRKLRDSCQDKFVLGYNSRGDAYCHDVWEPHNWPVQHADSLANAAAAAWCHLAEQKLLPTQL